MTLSMILAVACVVMGIIHFLQQGTAREKIESLAVMAVSVCWFVAEVRLMELGA